MKSVVIHGAKDLRIDDLPMPDLAKAGDANGDAGGDANGALLIEIAVGGICGSDLHYFNHGGFGAIRLKEPMTLGHEVCGYIREIRFGSGRAGSVRAGRGQAGREQAGRGGAGAGVSVHDFAVGDLVAVSPSRPCGSCVYCRKAAYNHCLNMRFYGSAMPFPHIQGAFSRFISAVPAQCVQANGMPPGLAALAEPFAVVLNAVRRAGCLFGKNVLVTGCGPIGLLCLIAARRAGAKNSVAMDIAPAALDKAAAVGADAVFNPGTDAGREQTALYAKDKGSFDLVFECSGAQAALCAAIGMAKPGATLMQLGLGGDMTLPVAAVTAKELNLKGSFRFHDEFALAVQLIRSNPVDFSPLITHTMPLADAVLAFETANDRSTATKVQIDFMAENPC